MMDSFGSLFACSKTINQQTDQGSIKLLSNTAVTRVLVVLLIVPRYVAPTLQFPYFYIVINLSFTNIKCKSYGLIPQS